MTCDSLFVLLLQVPYWQHFNTIFFYLQCYRKVLAIDPTNQKALHNLCVVHFERQDFVVAERCFVHTLTVHPDVNYIRHHLDVVRNILRHGQRRVFNHLANPFS